MDDRRVGQRAVGARGVVVGDDDVEPGRARGRDLLDGGDRAVDGDQQVGPAGGEPLDGRHRQAVAVVDPARQVPVDFGAERAQRADEHGGGGDAVDVVVAVDGDPRVALDVAEDPLRGGAQAPERVERVRVGAGEELARAGGRVQPAAHQHLGDDVRDAEIGAQALGGGVVVRLDGEAGLHPAAERTFA